MLFVMERRTTEEVGSGPPPRRSTEEVDIGPPPRRSEEEVGSGLLPRRLTATQLKVIIAVPAGKNA